ncbi:hypothetical protein TBLA_0I02810 [Henningerozyma blattae CBS 6284]|uniref:Probable transporter MCH1 n=1 Tax=Henningerozyma blattae (strain ATCC 34711 / CBS 6284 / DSM 70876 / NBRC 10599 / NRRL Y-10934 / UCD 77-7) TaxID=1071380 RepID=I2H985_HENB6|nr:hypothetical protein TBLA_0I02810 [Tetrapisispora blattae CBS 6284]CCH62937.1 hypothetical protein TBLA_0I02810 [Tetrapisispora blattae CBS 6284]
MSPSRLERLLSYHIRHLLPHVLSHRNLYKLSYIFALLTAVTSGFISLISLFSAPWQYHLGYTSKQINIIASWTMLGMYLTPPVLGIMADIHGPITLSWLSLFLFVPSYAYLSYSFNQANNNITFLFTVISFINIGIATSALYFCSLITCAKLYPQRKLLSISLPTTCYGISSLIGSQFLRWKWFFTKQNYLDLARVFKCFSWIYLVVCILSWVATSFITLLSIIEEKERLSNDSSDNINTTGSSSTNNFINDTETETENENDISETTLLIPVQTKEENQKYIRIFLSDPTSYLLAISMFLSLGPLEMFVTDMGSLTEVLLNGRDNPTLSAELLSLYSFVSTAVRLSTGVLTDYLIKIKKSPKWILINYLILALISQLYILTLTSGGNRHKISDSKILLMGGLMGAVYGGMFTIYPTIVLLRYGQDHFGTVYGSLMTSPALGSAFACMLYAQIYDSNCKTSSLNDIANVISSSNCIGNVYRISSLQILISLLVTIRVLHCWGPKKI